MKSNVGNTDRIVRLVLAVLIAAVGFYFKSWWGLVAIVNSFKFILSGI
jgi:Protein of unknown function (DUF2892)